MEVQRIENFQMPNAVAHKVTQEDLQHEYDYYKAQKLLETMFMFGMISVDEFNRITEKIAKLSPRIWLRLWAK